MESSEIISTVKLSARARKKIQFPRCCLVLHTFQLSNALVDAYTSSPACSYTLFAMLGNVV